MLTVEQVISIVASVLLVTPIPTGMLITISSTLMVMWFLSLIASVIRLRIMMPWIYIINVTSLRLKSCGFVSFYEILANTTISATDNPKRLTAGSCWGRMNYRKFVKFPHTCKVKILLMFTISRKNCMTKSLPQVV